MVGPCVQTSVLVTFFLHAMQTLHRSALTPQGIYLVRPQSLHLWAETSWCTPSNCHCGTGPFQQVRCSIALATVLHLVGSAAGGVIVQSRLLEPSGISATSSVSHLPFSLRPLMGAPSFSTVPETCTSM